MKSTTRIVREQSQQCTKRQIYVQWDLNLELRDSRYKSYYTIKLLINPEQCTKRLENFKPNLYEQNY